MAGWPVRAQASAQAGATSTPQQAAAGSWEGASPAQVSGAGTLTDCMHEKNRAGRFSPKKMMSEAEADGRTATGGQRRGDSDRETEREEAGVEADPGLGEALGSSGHQQGTEPQSSQGGWGTS